MSKVDKFQRVMNVLLHILIGANIGIWMYKLEHR